MECVGCCEKGCVCVGSGWWGVWGVVCGMLWEGIGVWEVGGGVCGGGMWDVWDAVRRDVCVWEVDVGVCGGGTSSGG